MDDAHEILRQGKVKLLRLRRKTALLQIAELERQIQALGEPVEETENPWFGEVERAAYFGPVQDIS